MRVIGLGFQAGEEENSIVNDSMFMAQVTQTSRGRLTYQYWCSCRVILC